MQNSILRYVRLILRQQGGKKLLTHNAVHPLSVRSEGLAAPWKNGDLSPSMWPASAYLKMSESAGTIANVSSIGHIFGYPL